MSLLQCLLFACAWRMDADWTQENDSTSSVYCSHVQSRRVRLRDKLTSAGSSCVLPWTAVSGWSVAMAPQRVRPPNPFLCNSRAQICKSVTNFTRVHKTPMHALSWECFAIKQSSFWYPDVLLFTVTGKLLFKNCLELGAPTLGASGLFLPCRPHCYATVADPQMGDEGDTSPTGIQQFCPWKIPSVTHCVCQIVTTRAILWLTINKKRLTTGIRPSPSAPSWI